MANVLIVGGGISGLLAAYSLRGRHRVTLIERGNKLGGNYLAGGLKYIRMTDNFVRLADELKVDWTLYRPQGGVVENGQLHPHPEWLKSLPDSERRDIQTRHWRKTRGALEGFTESCMNDPLGEGSALALKMDLGKLLKELEAVVLDECREVRLNFQLLTLSEHSAEGKQLGEASFAPHERWTFDCVILTAPMPVLSGLAPWLKLPFAVTRPLTVVEVESPGTYLFKMSGVDYVYTMDSRFVSRVSRVGDNAYQVEAPGDINLEAIGSDLDWMVPYKINFRRVMQGHLLPLASKPNWPRGWLPLGRFAEWNPRSTAEKVLERVIEFERSL